MPESPGRGGSRFNGLHRETAILGFLRAGAVPPRNHPEFSPSGAPGGGLKTVGCSRRWRPHATSIDSSTTCSSRGGSDRTVRILQGEHGSERSRDPTSYPSFESTIAKRFPPST